MKRLFAMVFGALSMAMCLSASADPTASAPPSARSIVEAWRRAVHSTHGEDGIAAHLRYASAENGVGGAVEEWVTPGASYRRSTKSAFDHDDELVTERGAQRRDWNDFVRDIDGTELQRLRSEACGAAAITFGPPAVFESATLGESDDHKSWTLTVTPTGGAATVWYVDRQTFLPAKSVLQADEITTAYGDWRAAEGTLVPQHLSVSQAGKPASEYTLGEPAQFSKARSEDFAALVPGPSDVAMASDVVTVPFTLEANHIVVQVQVNGRPPIGFVFDTGDDNETINAARLSEFGLKTYGESKLEGGGGAAGSSYAMDATLALPGVELRRQHATVLDLSGLERVFGVKIGGILGFDFISRFVVEIDYENKVLKLNRPDTWRYSGRGVVVPATFDNGIPYAEAVLSVPTKPHLAAHVLLDFGAADTMVLTSPFVLANDLIRLAGTDTSVNKMAGSEHQFFAQSNMRGRIDQLDLGGVVVRSIPVSLSANTSGAYASSTFAGTVGEGIYTRYHIFIDYPRHRVVFESTAKSDVPFEERRTFGLTLIASGVDLHTFTITGVRKDSPADAAGFKKDDIVAGLDDKKAAQFTLGELRAWLTHEGERHVFRLTRAGQETSIDTTIVLVSIDRKSPAN